MKTNQQKSIYKMKEEIKEALKEWYDLEVESETPLVLKDVQGGIKLVGLIAKLVITEIEAELNEEESELDLEKLNGLDDNDKLLVTGDFDYADEFNLSEWSTMTVAEFKEMIEHLKSRDDEFEIGFGTNEALSFSDGEDLLSQLSFRKISEQEYDVLDKLFGGEFDGGGGVFERLWEIDEDYDDEDEDDEEEEEEIIFDKNDLRNIETIKKYGWDVSIHNQEQYQLAFTSPEGEVSITEFSILDDLANYLRKNQ